MHIEGFFDASMIDGIAFRSLLIDLSFFGYWIALFHPLCLLAADRNQKILQMETPNEWL
jgi:hypothetical protein